MAQRIQREFEFDPAATLVDTPPHEAFLKRRGVCQDFAQIMITGLRAAGLPAAYASGYIRTLPPPGQERLVGADATHAWVLLWCGPVRGWIGVDPHKVARHRTAFTGFVPVARQVVQWRLALHPDEAAALASMGPNAHHRIPDPDAEGVPAELPDLVGVTAAMDVVVYRRR